MHARTVNGPIYTEVEAEEIEFTHSLKDVKEIFHQYLSNDDYMDVHSWIFVPESFRIIIKNLVELEYLNFDIGSFFNTQGFEFFYSLRKNTGPKKDMPYNRKCLSFLTQL